MASPPSNTTRIATISVNARVASLTVGFLNSGTPLLMASTPVIAVQPLANARRKSQAPTAAVAVVWSGGGSDARGSGFPPARIVLVRPMTTVTINVATNR
jgi:hypothetical protein